MNRARDELLARSALAEQQHGRVGGRRALDRVPDLPQRRRFADHLVTDFNRPLQRGVLVAQSRLVQRVPDGDEHALAGERLFDEIESAKFGRLDRGADGAVPRNNDHRQRLVRRLDPLQRIQAVHPRHLDVEEHEIRRLTFGQRHSLGSAGRLDHLVALVFEDHPDRTADLRLIVYDQDAGFHE